MLDEIESQMQLADLDKIPFMYWKSGQNLLCAFAHWNNSPLIIFQTRTKSQSDKSFFI